MKKIIILAVVSLLGLTSVKAQSYGIKGGVNFANLSGGDTDGFDGLTGFHVGRSQNLKYSRTWLYNRNLYIRCRALSLMM